MKFTPLDIQRREFEKGFRGLEEGEVRAFLLEVAGEWEELQMENSRLRTEILDLREHLKQYQDQDRIFRETLLNAQRTKEEILDAVNREKALILREADFKADELLRDAMTKSQEMDAALRGLKLERVRFLQDMDSLLARTRRFLQEEAPEIFPPAEATRRLEEKDAAKIDQLAAQPPPRPAKTGFGADGA
ncbi:DivIVA domain-containing protein [Mesoterricola silvestris]|uniref:DivIVA domain-containing protein n=1 Tax=Mesoterricola silvestris TaxID=2927979 RepID=A0AA48K8P2_9BACT|nr:DivIVA domain-containing protein [Mesoterricola silvestris]BDU73129.1 DivIVA domain-containing protein [Mesoterricola silvestris]